MKKLVVFLLSAALSLLFVLAASAATCTHNWRLDYEKSVAATCEKEGSNVYVCSRCSDTKTEKIAKTGHDFIKAEETAPTCEEIGVVVDRCSVCSAEQRTETEALGHTYKVTKTVAATCLEAGSETSKCSRCSHVKTEELEAQGHDFSKFISSSATCTTKGQTTYQCVRCTEIVLRTVSSLGHDYEEKGGPTCTESGRITYTCKRCEKSYQSSVKRALGHDLPAKDEKGWTVTKKATCDSEGTRRARCARCKTYVTETIEKTEHNYGSKLYLTKVPTASTTGKYTKTCSVCNKTVENTISRGTTDLSAYTIPQVNASVASGHVDKGVTVKFTCALEGVSIYYTFGSQSPKTSASRKLYSAPVTVDESVRIRVCAVYDKNGVELASPIRTFTYTVKGENTWLYLKEDAADGGYIKLGNDRKFRPDDKATRYEVIMALDALFDSWTDNAEIDFTDVQAEYKDAVAKFVGAELVDGYEDKTFRGNANIKRSELCKLLVLALGLDLEDAGTLAFGDVKKDHWAYDYIALLTEAEYLKGDTEGNFRPEDSLTRAELITVLNRVAGVESTGGVALADVPASHWAYAYVCGAVND